MPLLVRKINRAKWPAEPGELKDDLPADAITNCLQTKYNTLSTWEIEDYSAVEEAGLALIAGADHLDTIDVVFIDKNEVVGKGIVLKDTKGFTPIEDLVDKHKDLSELSYKTLGEFALLIASCFRRDQTKRFTRTELKKLIIKAVKDGRLGIEQIPENIKKHVINDIA